MSRICTVCKNPNRAAIDAALVSQTPLRDIAERFDVSRSAVSRHKAEHLPQIMLLQDESIPSQIDSLFVQLRESLERLNLLSDAVDEWLRDPEDPSRYDIGPRSGDMMVICERQDVEGRPQRQKVKLSAILAELEDAGVTVESVEVRHADPRELMLKTADAINGQLRLWVSVYDKLYQAKEVAAFEEIVLDVIGEVSPETRQKIERRLLDERPVRRVLSG